MHRLFIVEDEAIIAMDLAEQLEEFGYEIVGVAHDGESALEQLKDLDPDLILMDIVLGSGIDGIETAERILQTRALPIIFLTAFSDPQTINRAAQTAPYGYVTKPYQIPALQAAIEVAMTKHQLEHKLLYKERWFSNILHAVNDAIIAVGIDGLVHFANDEACRILELDNTGLLIGKSIDKVIHLYDSTGNKVEISPVSVAMQQNSVLPITFGGSVKNPQTGNRIFLDYTAAPVRGASNMVVGGILALRDASDRLSIESKIKTSDDQFNQAFNNTAVGIALVGFNNLIINYNPAFQDIFQLDEHAHNLNLLDDVIPYPNDRDSIREGLLPLFSGQISDLKYDLHLRVKNTFLSLKVIVTLLHDKEQKPAYYLYQIFNETDRLTAEKHLHHIIHYDVLTGLVNLPQIKQEISRLLELCQEEQMLLAVATIDIDQFRNINDRFSPEVGDDLLSQMALRLTDMGFYNQIVGRTSGDRFTLVMHSLESVNQAMYSANRALEELNEPFYIGAEAISLTGCIGIAVAPEDGQEVEQLLANSDSALRIAKSNGSNQISFFNKGATLQMKERIKNEARIYQALEQRELECHPFTVCDAQGRIQGLRLSSYWPEDARYFTPFSFINIANFTDAPLKLMDWMIDQAFDQLRTAPGNDEGFVILPFYAPLLGSGPLLQLIQGKIQRFQLNPRQLVLELSELLLTESASSLEYLRRLKQQGFRCCIHHDPGHSLTLNFLQNAEPDFYMLSKGNEQSSPDPNYLTAVSRAVQALEIPMIFADFNGQSFDGLISERDLILKPLQAPD